jgi:hypothetical protein
MIFAAGSTACPSCGKPLDATDDFIAIETPLRVDLPESGFYHVDCFDRLPNRAPYLEYFRSRTRSYLESQSNLWNILELHDRYSVAYVPFTDEAFIFFIAKGRLVNLSCKGPWAEFCDFLLGYDLRDELQEGNGLKAPLFSESNLFALKPQPSGGPIVLELRNGVHKMLRFTVSQFEKLKQVRDDVSSPGAFIDFNALCSQTDTVPVLVDGFLENCKGIITGVVEKNARVDFRFVAEKWLRIPLTFSELQELIDVMQRVS